MTQTELQKAQDEISRLIATNKALVEQVSSKRKLKFRIESTQEANNFHISFNEIFEANTIKKKYSSKFIKHDNEKNVDVYDKTLRDSLKSDILEAFKSE